MADGSAVATWLDGIRDGLGTHTDVFVQYGASAIADLRDLDDDDVNQLTTQLAAVEDTLAPLQLKQIAKALRSLMEPSPPNSASIFHTPPTNARAGTRGSSSSSAAAAKQEVCEEADEPEGSDGGEYERRARSVGAGHERGGCVGARDGRGGRCHQGG